VLFGFYFEGGLPGMWYGYGVGIFVLNVIYLQKVIGADWEAISLQIQMEASESDDE